MAVLTRFIASLSVAFLAIKSEDLAIEPLRIESTKKVKAVSSGENGHAHRQGIAGYR